MSQAILHSRPVLLGRKAFWAIAGLALLVRLVAVAAVDLPAGLFDLPDSAEYDRLAANLVAYRSFSLSESPPLTPDLTRTPVYPGFVALCYGLGGREPLLVILLQVGLGVGTCLLGYGIADRLHGPMAATVAGVLLALDPLSVRHAALLLSEILFTLLFLLSLVGLLAWLRRPRPTTAMAIGLLTGICILCRPVALLWPAALLPTVLLVAWHGRRWRLLAHYGIFLVLVLAVVVPWVVRNRKAGGLAVLSTIGGINLYYHRAAAIRARQKHIPIAEARRQLAERLHRAVEEEQLDTAQTYHRLVAWGQEVHRDAPDVYLQLHAEGARRMFLPNDRPTPIWGFSAAVVYHLEAAFLAIVYLLAGVGFLSGLRRPGRAAYLLLAAVPLYYALVSGPEAYARFRVPVMPALCVLAAVGAAALAGSRVPRPAVAGGGA